MDRPVIHPEGIVGTGKVPGLFYFRGIHRYHGTQIGGFSQTDIPDRLPVVSIDVDVFGCPVHQIVTRISWFGKIIGLALTIPGEEYDQCDKNDLSNSRLDSQNLNTLKFNKTTIDPLRGHQIIVTA